MWPSEGTQLLVGSKSTQPAPGLHAEHHACDASAPIKPRLSGGRASPQISADVAGGQSQRPQAGDLQMREVLAHAAALFKERLDRRADFGGLGVEPEIMEDAAGEVHHGFEQRTPLGERFDRVLAQLRPRFDPGGIEHELVGVRAPRRCSFRQASHARFPMAESRRNRGSAGAVTSISLIASTMRRSCGSSSVKVPVRLPK